MSTPADLERLKDKADRLQLVYQLGFNVPDFVPLRIGRECRPPSPLDSEAQSLLQSMASRHAAFTLRFYKPDQTVGSEPLLLNVQYEEGLVCAHVALGISSVAQSGALSGRVESLRESLRARADSTLETEGYSFGREYYRLLSRNRDGIRLNVLFQEYIDRDHAERSGRIAFYRDERGIYSYKSAESGLGPIVRDVDYTGRGVVSGMFSRSGEIADDLMRAKVAHPLRTLVEIFAWKQGVVVEFDYHTVPVGRRAERLVIYDFHEAGITVADVTGRALSNPTDAASAGIIRPKKEADPRGVAERVLGALPQQAAYVSGEITTGLKFYRLLKELGIDDMTEVSETKAPLLERRLRTLLVNNVSRMRKFADRLRSREPSRPVINPGEIHVPDWNQDDYMVLWERVIRWGVGTVYFLDGWEYSNGAAAEYGLGREIGIELLDERGRVLDVTGATRRLKGAIDGIRRMGFEAPTLENVLRKLHPDSAVPQRPIA